jgi:centromeric protein E
MTEGIKVAIRVRPLNERELNQAGNERIFKCDIATNSIYPINIEGQPIEGSVYCYDHVFDEGCRTKDVYSQTGKHIVNGVMNGINGTIFAYGQTSSGKTHTMLGGGGEKGVLEMAVDDIFSFIAETPSKNFILRGSFVEVYQENIKDLLGNSSEFLKIREDTLKGVYYEATEVPVNDVGTLKKHLQNGKFSLLFLLFCWTNMGFG